MPDWDETNRNWMRYGAIKVEEEAQEDSDFADEVKNEVPRLYYSWDWTPDDPAL